MSTNVSSFYTREIYNDGLWARYGAPTSLENYLLKAQTMDYEATRAQFEAYAVKWTAERPATGLIYWMLNNAWPSLHWNLFDYYLHPAGSYFGAKVGSRSLHVAYDYLTRSVHLINRSLYSLGSSTVHAELLDLNGKRISSTQATFELSPNNSTRLFEVADIDKIRNVALLKLVLKRQDEVLSRNVYHLTPRPDALDFDNSTWYHTPVTKYANFTALNKLPLVDLAAKATAMKTSSTAKIAKVELHNKSKVPAVFIRLNLVSTVEGSVIDINPVTWSDNYITLWPDEKLELEVKFLQAGSTIGVEIDGWNVEKWTISVDMGY